MPTPELTPRQLRRLKRFASSSGLGDYTSADLTDLVDVFTPTLKGLAPASGGSTSHFLRADGTWTAPPSPALNDLTDATVSGATQGQVLVRGVSEFQNLTMMTVTLGPFFISDVIGTGSETATQAFFNTSTALNRSVIDPVMPKNGRVVGMFMCSDANRTAGTATAKVRIGGVDTTFNSDSVQLNGTNVNRTSSVVAFANGPAFVAGNAVSASVVTSGWTPTTANISIFVVVAFDPF